MFTLITDKSKYFRIKKGQCAAEIEKQFTIPLCGQTFAGKIVIVESGKFCPYIAEVGDTYKTIALKFGTDETKLKTVNGFKPVYPTCKLFVPCN